MLGTVLSTIKQSCEVDIITAFLHVEKPRHREVNFFTVTQLERGGVRIYVASLAPVFYYTILPLAKKPI